MSSSPAHSVLYMFILPCLDIFFLSFFLFSGGGHIDQNGISDYNVNKKKKKKKKKKGSRPCGFRQEDFFHNFPI